MKTEFNIGDKVTFHPYEKGHAAVIKGVQEGMFSNMNDDRIFYELTGYGKSVVNSICTGKSIEESVLYDEWTEEKAKNFFKN